MQMFNWGYFFTVTYKIKSKIGLHPFTLSSRVILFHFAAFFMAKRKL